MIVFAKYQYFHLMKSYKVQINVILNFEEETNNEST